MWSPEGGGRSQCETTGCTFLSVPAPLQASIVTGLYITQTGTCDFSKAQCQQTAELFPKRPGSRVTGMGGPLRSWPCGGSSSLSLSSLGGLSGCMDASPDLLEKLHGAGQPPFLRSLSPSSEASWFKVMNSQNHLLSPCLYFQNCKCPCLLPQHTCQCPLLPLCLFWTPSHSTEVSSP